MELVFVYVCEHKILENIGVSISSRFKSSYERGLLKIEENDKRIDSYYDGVLINAIIGKNGVGKSSLLEFIESSFYDTDSSGFLVWYDKKMDNIHLLLVNFH